MRLAQIALLCVAAILASQMIMADANKQREGRKERERDPNQKQRGGNKEERKQSQSGGAEKERGSRGGKGALQGKFASKEKADCVWSVSGTESMVLHVSCTKGGTSVSCNFGGNPKTCPKYANNEKSYWKQITRALRKQKNICQDQKAVLKSKECKKGPQEAHFSYILQSVPEPQPEPEPEPEVQRPAHPEPKPDTKKDEDCPEHPDPEENQRRAKEYCGDSWSSLCLLLFSMVQSKAC